MKEIMFLFTILYYLNFYLLFWYGIWLICLNCKKVRFFHWGMHSLQWGKIWISEENEVWKKRIRQIFLWEFVQSIKLVGCSYLSLMAVTCEIGEGSDIEVWFVVLGIQKAAKSLYDVIYEWAYCLVELVILEDRYFGVDYIIFKVEVNWFGDNWICLKL